MCLSTPTPLSSYQTLLLAPTGETEAGWRTLPRGPQMDMCSPSPPSGLSEEAIQGQERAQIVFPLAQKVNISKLSPQGTLQGVPLELWSPPPVLKVNESPFPHQSEDGVLPILEATPCPLRKKETISSRQHPQGPAGCRRNSPARNASRCLRVFVGSPPQWPGVLWPARHAQGDRERDCA